MANVHVPIGPIPRRVTAALLGQPRTLLTERQAQTVDALKNQCPGFTTMRRLTLSFRSILRVGKVTVLHRWIARAAAHSGGILAPSKVPSADRSIV